MLFVTNLFHVNVHGGNVFIARVQTRVLTEQVMSDSTECKKTTHKSCTHLIFAGTPLSEIFHLLHQMITKRFRHDGKPENILTRLFDWLASVHDLAVVGVQVARFPIETISMDFPQFAVQLAGRKRLTADQMAEFVSIAQPHEDFVFAQWTAKAELRVGRRRVDRIERKGRLQGGRLIDFIRIRLVKIVFDQLVAQEGTVDQVHLVYVGNIPEATVW